MGFFDKVQNSSKGCVGILSALLNGYQEPEPEPASEPAPEPELGSEEEPVFYYVKDSAINYDKTNFPEFKSIALYKSQTPNLTDTDFINYALKKMSNIENVQALVVVYQDNTRQKIKSIIPKSSVDPYNKPDTTTGQVVFFEDLNEAQTNWKKNNPKIIMDYKKWNNGYESETEPAPEPEPEPAPEPEPESTPQLLPFYTYKNYRIPGKNIQYPGEKTIYRSIPANETNETAITAARKYLFKCTNGKKVFAFVLFISAKNKDDRRIYLKSEFFGNINDFVKKNTTKDTITIYSFDGIEFGGKFLKSSTSEKYYVSIEECKESEASL